MFNYLDIQFPTLDIQLSRSNRINITHARYEHELMKIYLVNWEVPYESISSGTPINVVISGVGTSRTFYGYVHHITPELAPDKNYVTITAIGASYIFKQQSQNSWFNATADQVIADIATTNGFSYIATPHPRVYEQISQAGMSDWELMVKLAKQSGYSLKCDNTTLIFQPLTQAFTDFRQQAFRYTMRGLNNPATGIYSFTPSIGEAIPYKDAKKGTVSISGTDRSSAIPHTKVNQETSTTTRRTSVTPVFDVYHTDVVAPTYEIAQHEATAADERNRYAYRGEAVIQGNAMLLPDAPVFLDGIGNTYSGFWTVLSTEHHIEGQEYTTTIEVGTDSLGIAGAWTDNKNVTYPAEAITRVITPGMRQTNIVPITTLKKLGSSPKKASAGHFSVVKNQPKASILGAPSYTWVGSGGNLKQTAFIETSTPAVVLQKRLGG